MIGTAAGTFVLPALEVPWWNIDAAEWQVARLPERTISILPSSELPAAPVQPAVPSDAATGEPVPAAVPGADPFWRRASELLGALWLLTLIAWWWSSRPKKAPREPAPVPIHRQQAKHLKAARKAALDGDGAGVRRAMLDWAALQWPTDVPRSIGVLATRVSAPLSDERTA